MSNFDEKTDLPTCLTSWGRWWQTIDDIEVEVNRPGSKSQAHCCQPITAKNVKCVIQKSSLFLSVDGKSIIEGPLHGTIRPDESTWSLEDKKLIRILLAKANPDAANCWTSLLGVDNEQTYVPEPHILDQMKRKLTLQRMQQENPGMDFSNAEISGNYQDGGPRFP